MGRRCQRRCQDLGSAFVSYARDELGFKTEMTYNLLASEVANNGIGTTSATRRRAPPMICGRSWR
jgi:hypothetical protein